MSSNPNPHPPVINLEEQQSNSPAQPQEAIRHVDPIKFPRLASILMSNKVPSQPIEIENNIEPPAIKDVSSIQEQFPEVEQIQVRKESEGIAVPDIKEEFRRRCEEVEKEKERQIQIQFQNQKDFNQLKQAGEEDKFQQPIISSVVASIPESMGEAMQDHLHHTPPQSSNEQITPTFNEIEVRIDPEQAALPTIQVATEGQLQEIPEHFEEQPSSPQPQRQLGVQAEKNIMETQERKMSTDLMEPVASEPSSMMVERQSSDNRSENLQIEALFTSRVRSLCEYPRNQSLSQKNEISVKGSVDIDRDIVKPLIEESNQEVPNSAQEEQGQVSEQKPHKNQEGSNVMIAEEKAEFVVQDKEQQLVQAPQQPTFIPITAQPIIHIFDKQSVEVEEKQNEIRGMEAPVDDAPIIGRVQPSENMQKEKKVETKPKWKRLFGSIECVRAFLFEKFPEYKTMVETLKEEELQQLLDQFQSSANQCLKTKQPSIRSIRSQCIAMFPHLSQKILAKTPEEILQLWKQSKRESSFPKKITVPGSGQKIQNTRPDQNQKVETPLPRTDRNPSKYPEGHGKRTYHEMLETKPQKESSPKKNKFFISEIRRFLIEKLPTLKDKINKLSDIDLANVYKQTVQTKKKSENNIIAGDSKTKSADHISGSAIERVNKAVPEDKVYIFEGVDERGQEGTKKIATVHTEADMSLDECQGEEASLKRINGPKGVELKCACDCCNRMNNVNDLLGRLAAILEQKK